MNQPPKTIHFSIALLLLPIGGILIGGSKFGASFVAGSANPETALLAASFIGVVLWIWGCIHFAIASKLNPGFGFLGLFFIVGLFALIWLAKKQPEMERAAARKLARNPKKEYRGDPNSLY